MIELAIACAGSVALAAGVASAALLHPASPLGKPVRRTSQPGVALTFDDGPDPEWTPLVLEVLQRLGATASFFVLGEKVAAHPEIVARCAAEGHSIEIHGQSHRVATFQRVSHLAGELRGMVAQITALTGRPPRWYRPPYGARPLTAWPFAGLAMVTWSWSCQDWLVDPIGPFAEARAGDIALLHDGEAPPAARKRTLAALRHLAASGLALHALPDP